MAGKIVTGSFIDVISCAVEIIILLWLFDTRPDREEVRDSWIRKAAGFVPRPRCSRSI
jgi:hypothetical protein